MPLEYALPSLQSYTGIWHMPTARILPDWTMRLGYGQADPYRYYGGALGVFDRLELHGQFTEVTSLSAFGGEGYGNYKDRSAGARLVLVPEDTGLPQIAIGAYDATGTGLFPSRYIAFSKLMGDVDFTIGLGQGILAGDYPAGEDNGDDQAFSFLLSDPFRSTSLFGGLEYHVTPELTLSAEYSSLDWSNMFGFRNTAGTRVKDADTSVDINLGLKYTWADHVHASLALLRGTTLAGGLQINFPLEPEGMLPWKRTEIAPVGEKKRWEAYLAGNAELARRLARVAAEDGFEQVQAAVSDNAVWIEYVNAVHSSPARSFGHVFALLDPYLPQRIDRVYLNIKDKGQVLQSLRASRRDITDFLNSRIKTRNFLQRADLTLYADRHWREFSAGEHPSTKVKAPEDRLHWGIYPRVRTFLNNRAGFFKHKGLVELESSYRLWPGAWAFGRVEFPVFNQYDDLVWTPLEDEDSVRTDLVEYQKQSDIRITTLALSQHVSLPGEIQARVSAGIFESAFAGFGAECFRYFHDGLWGIGLEAEAVRKREVDENFSLRSDADSWYTPAFINLYAQIWPSQGLEAGIKAGRFLAGDPGARFEIRRHFKNFTIGAYYTKTRTDVFDSPKNRDSEFKGVYIRVPFSLFRDRDEPGHLRYEFTSFTRDQGQTVSQPDRLYPMDGSATPIQTRRKMDEMPNF
jgi:hypothetical protein